MQRVQRTHELVSNKSPPAVEEAVDYWMAEHKLAQETLTSRRVAKLDITDALKIRDAASNNVRHYRRCLRKLLSDAEFVVMNDRRVKDGKIPIPKIAPDFNGSWMKKKVPAPDDIIPTTYLLPSPKKQKTDDKPVLDTKMVAHLGGELRLLTPSSGVYLGGNKPGGYCNYQSYPSYYGPVNGARLVALEIYKNADSEVNYLVPIRNGLEFDSSRPRIRCFNRSIIPTKHSVLRHEGSIHFVTPSGCLFVNNFFDGVFVVCPVLELSPSYEDTCPDRCIADPSATV